MLNCHPSSTRYIQKFANYNMAKVPSYFDSQCTIKEVVSPYFSSIIVVSIKLSLNN